MKAAKKPALEAPWENPLIPNKRLREIYTAIAELRLLEEHLAQRKPRQRSASQTSLTFGEEACRASTALSLIPGDMTSDPGSGAATRFLRGARLADVVAQQATPSELPHALDPERRLLLAIGAALALASKKKGLLVAAYLHSEELTLPEWKPIFRLAAGHSAPLIFVALPPTGVATKPGKLSEVSTAAGVPGITVDAADAVALYRVVQESMLRARAGGGPVLMECIPFQIPGENTAPTDPVLNMQASLIHRKLADEAWFQAVEARFTARLAAANLE